MCRRNAGAESADHRHRDRSGINAAFAGHFNTLARYHFGIRRQYEADFVLAEYARQLTEFNARKSLAA